MWINLLVSKLQARSTRCFTSDRWDRKGNHSLFSWRQTVIFHHCWQVLVHGGKDGLQYTTYRLWFRPTPLRICDYILLWIGRKQIKFTWNDWAVGNNTTDSQQTWMEDRSRQGIDPINLRWLVSMRLIQKRNCWDAPVLRHQQKTSYLWY